MLKNLWHESFAKYNINRISKFESYFGAFLTKYFGVKDRFSHFFPHIHVDWHSGYLKTLYQLKRSCSMRLDGMGWRINGWSEEEAFSNIISQHSHRLSE
jgi:hypothetical protein